MIVANELRRREETALKSESKREEESKRARTGE